MLKTTDGMKVSSSTSKIQEEVYIASVPKNRLFFDNEDIAAYMHTKMNSVSTIGE